MAVLRFSSSDRAGFRNNLFKTIRSLKTRLYSAEARPHMTPFKFCEERLVPPWAGPWLRKAIVALISAMSPKRTEFFTQVLRATSVPSECPFRKLLEGAGCLSCYWSLFLSLQQ